MKGGDLPKAFGAPRLSSILAPFVIFAFGGAPPRCSTFFGEFFQSTDEHFTHFLRGLDQRGFGRASRFWRRALTFVRYAKLKRTYLKVAYTWL
jgi:hypothetical protein